jgi:transcriptional regulator
MGENNRAPSELVPGTLGMLALKALSTGEMHGYGIAEVIKRYSEYVLQVEEGALYPALHRLEVRGLLSSRWGLSGNNRRAKFYGLTAAGRKVLAQETAQWSRVAAAIDRVMRMA